MATRDHDRDHDTKLSELTAWTQQAAQKLSLKPLEEHDISTVLAAASQASAGLVRSAGPVTMYLAGLLFATGQATDVATACQMVGRLMDIPELTVGLDEGKDPRQSLPD